MLNKRKPLNKISEPEKHQVKKTKAYPFDMQEQKDLPLQVFFFCLEFCFKSRLKHSLFKEYTFVGLRPIFFTFLRSQIVLL